MARGLFGFSNQIDHASLKEIELATDLSVGASHAAAWRERAGLPLPYDPRTLPSYLRPIFLAEMRMVLVRVVHAADELAQVERGHSGPNKEDMLVGISHMHASIRRSNPEWLLDLLRQLPEASPADVDGGEGRSVRLGELRTMAHRAGPWWI